MSQDTTQTSQDDGVSADQFPVATVAVTCATRRGKGVLYDGSMMHPVPRGCCRLLFLDITGNIKADVIPFVSAYGVEGQICA